MWSPVLGRAGNPPLHLLAQNPLQSEACLHGSSRHGNIVTRGLSLRRLTLFTWTVWLQVSNLLNRSWTSSTDEQRAAQLMIISTQTVTAADPCMSPQTGGESLQSQHCRAVIGGISSLLLWHHSCNRGPASIQRCKWPAWLKPERSLYTTAHWQCVCWALYRQPHL